MSTYKLFYFNVSGLAEPIRFLLHYCGIKFEDFRFSFEDWPKHKPNMPIGQVPVLEIDGIKYHESKAISRFIAKKGNLYGSNDREAMEIDVMTDTIDDLRLALITYYLEEEPTFRDKLKETAYKKLSLYLDKFEVQVKKNGGYFVGDKLSWADIMWAAFNELLSYVLAADVTKDHPELKKVVDKVYSLPNIKGYLEKRLETDWPQRIN